MYSLIGIDGNANSIMSYIRSVMKECSISEEDIELYVEDAKSEDYDHLVDVSMAVLDFCNELKG